MFSLNKIQEQNPEVRHKIQRPAIIILYQPPLSPSIKWYVRDDLALQTSINTIRIQFASNRYNYNILNLTNQAHIEKTGVQLTDYKHEIYMRCKR